MKEIVTRLNQATGNSVDIIQRTTVRIGEERAAEAAASMAYYGFFSLFPLLLVAVVVVSTVLENMLSQAQVLDMLLQAFPFSGDLIEDNIAQVLRARGSVGIIGLVGLAWSAMGAFAVLTRNINRAWPNTKVRNFIKMRLVSLAMLTAMIAGLIALFIFSTISRLLPPTISDAADRASSIHGFQNFLMGLLLFTSLLVLYWWLPRTKVRWKEAAFCARI